MKGSYEEGGRKERERQTSEEEEDEEEEEEEREQGGGGEMSIKRPKNTISSDGASIEVVRRPRGRPPGSKNKPKPPPVIIARETTDSSMSPHVLHLPAGLDVVDAISRFARRLNVGLCVLTGTGTVANVTLRHPTTTVTFHGRYDILSISATFLPPSSPPSFQSNGFKVLIAGAQGEIVGGSVVGSLVAVGTVVVVATVFSSPSFHRLSGEEEISLSGSGTSTHHHQFEQQQQQQQDDHESHLSVYSCNLPSSVIWAPIARPPPPY